MPMPPTASVTDETSSRTRVSALAIAAAVLSSSVKSVPGDRVALVSRLNHFEDLFRRQLDIASIADGKEYLLDVVGPGKVAGD